MAASNSSVVIPSTVVPSVIPQGAKVSAVFSINLSSGSQSADVIRLQQLLSQDKAIYPAGLVTGFYGSLTVEAVKKFQTKYGLPAIGIVGPMTRAKLTEVFGGIGATTVSGLQAQVDALMTQLGALQETTGTANVDPGITFSSNLSLGQSGPSVKKLQQILNFDPETQIVATGAGSKGNETDRFGALTEAAVKKFQVKYGIAKQGDSGYGYVGPMTRAKLEAVLGKSN